MMKYFYGTNRKAPYFEGWYFKLQAKDGRGIALIPAFHIDSASLQIITAGKSWWLEYPVTAFAAAEKALKISVGQNQFTGKGISLNIRQKDLVLQGALRFGPLLPLQSDIMGPFRFFSGMECSHGVISMAHSLEGRLTLNGEVLDFSGGVGYIETDRGRSFPGAYLWTQCVWQESYANSLMLSIASIPLPVGKFTGCICAIIHNGQEYRLATYRGVRILRWSRNGAVIRQGKYRLEVELPEAQGQPLLAPVEGNMGRTIHENLHTTMRYRFWCGNTLLFDHTDSRGSFEYTD